MIETIMEALKAVREPRFFDTERGYQGEFLAELRHLLPGVGLPGEAIVEQEYQKKLSDHGITIRPDLIIHVPTEVGGVRRSGNFVVFELKLRASPTESQAAFKSLDTVVRALNYPLAIFVNIASDRTQATRYEGRFKDRLHCFAVQLAGGNPMVKHKYWREGRELVEDQQNVA